MITTVDLNRNCEGAQVKTQSGIERRRRREAQAQSSVDVTAEVSETHVKFLPDIPGRFQEIGAPVLQNINIKPQVTLLISDAIKSVADIHKGATACDAQPVVHEMQVGAGAIRVTAILCRHRKSADGRWRGL